MYKDLRICILIKKSSSGKDGGVVNFMPSHTNRLVEDEERRWTDENIDVVALKHFPNIDREKGLSRPILYSNWLSKVRLPFVLSARRILIY